MNKLHACLICCIRIALRIPDINTIGDPLPFNNKPDILALGFSGSAGAFDIGECIGKRNLPEVGFDISLLTVAHDAEGVFLCKCADNRLFIRKIRRFIAGLRIRQIVDLILRAALQNRDPVCIRQIRNYLTPETKLLDIGTGSGILSILALKLGAKEAVGTDLDPNTEPAIQDNLAQNGVDPAGFTLFLGNLIDDRSVQDAVGYEKYDIVAANILPDVLIPLTPAAVAAMKPGAVYITSGILAGREESVAEAMRAQGLEIVSVTAQGEWRCVTGRKP